MWGVFSTTISYFFPGWSTFRRLNPIYIGEYNEVYWLAFLLFLGGALIKGAILGGIRGRALVRFFNEYLQIRGGLFFSVFFILFLAFLK